MKALGRLGIIIGIVGGGIGIIIGYTVFSTFIAKFIFPLGSHLDKLNGLAFNTYVTAIVIIPITIFVIYLISMGLFYLIFWICFGYPFSERKLEKKIIDKDIVAAQEGLDEEFPGMENH